MKRLYTVLIIIFFTIPVLSGCDFKDIDRRLFILAIGIDSDKEDPKSLMITLKAVVPAGSGPAAGSQSDIQELYRISGTSLANIFREVKAQTTFEPDFSHMKMLVFGKDFAEKNSIVSIIDFFTRRRDFQKVAYITVGEPGALEVLTLAPKDEKFTGNALFMKYGQGTDSPYSDELKLYELYSDTVMPGTTPSCSIIEAKEDKLDMKKIAVFSNGKLVLELNGNESKIFNLLKRKLRFSSISVAEDEDAQPTGLGINSGYSKIKVDINPDGTTICHVDTFIDGVLEEASKQNEDVEKVVPEFSLMFQKRIMRLMEKFSEAKVDPLMLQIEYWAGNSNYEFSESWLKDKFPNIKYEITPHVTMYSTGNIKISKE